MDPIAWSKTAVHRRWSRAKFLPVERHCFSRVISDLCPSSVRRPARVFIHHLGAVRQSSTGCGHDGGAYASPFAALGRALAGMKPIATPLPRLVSRSALG